MKIKTIEIQRVRNLGNYESARLSVEAEVSEDDKVSDVVDKLELFIDHKLNSAEREAKYEKYIAELETELKEKDRELREGWIKQYHEHNEKVNALDFL